MSRPTKLRPGQLTEKDMSIMREADRAQVQAKTCKASLRDYSLSHRVTMYWDLNDEAVKDQIFRLKIDDVEVLIDKEELLRYLRWV
jgi:hypothetical protein